MPRTENYQYPHSYFTPEPHCVPGYTGYLPGFGPHKLYQFGKTYGRMTHDIMEVHPVAGGRLGKLLECSNVRSSSAQKDKCCTKKLRDDMIPNYTGHVPRRKFFCGTGYQEECRRGINEFQAMQARRQDNRTSYKYLPPEDLLPRTVVFPRRLCERPEHQSIPAYCTFTNPMNYGQNVFDMSDLDPRKTYMPGYTGYYTGKYRDVGVTHGRGANQDLCDATSSRLERYVAARRPKVSDWYSCPKLQPPEAREMVGYHPPPYRAPKPVPGYAGHVPGFRDQYHSLTYGEAAGIIQRDRELSRISEPPGIEVTA